MDNLPAHRSVAARDAIHRAGAELRFLPPCSPDFNPIERAFSKLKASLKRRPARTIPELRDAIGEATNTFTSAECQNYFTAAGYERVRSDSALTGAAMVSAMDMWPPPPDTSRSLRRATYPQITAEASPPTTRPGTRSDIDLDISACRHMVVKFGIHSDIGLLRRAGRAVMLEPSPKFIRFTDIMTDAVIAQKTKAVEAWLSRRNWKQ